MDAIVEKALAKWPNVPHCYGWLALDARGYWRMRDEQTQQKNLPGDRIQSPALIGFIQRNYTHDEQGRWYFQNGPQRVYVDLEATPYIVRTDPAAGLVLHTGQTVPSFDGIWLSNQGRLLLQTSQTVALLDDRDIAHYLPHLRSQHGTLKDEYLLEWIAQEGKSGSINFAHGAVSLPVNFINEEELETTFGFCQKPRI